MLFVFEYCCLHAWVIVDLLFLLQEILLSQLICGL
jgi:hypothetical protein